MFGKEEGKHKSRKTQAITQEKIINDDTEHRPTTAPSITIQDRDQRRDREIAIDGEIASFARSRSSRDRAVNRDLDPVARSQSMASRDHGLEIAINNGEIADWRSRSTTARLRHGDRNRARARALSLSLSFSGNTLKGK